MRIRLPTRPTSRPFSRRRLRLALLFLALTTSIILFLQLTLLPSIVRRPLQRALGGIVGITRVSFSLSSALVIHNLRISVPGVPGDAAQLLRVDKVRIELDASDLLNGIITPTRIVLNEPRLHISQHRDTGAVNAASLSPSHQPGGAVIRLPQMEIRNGAIELAEHSDQQAFDSFLTLPIEGAAAPDPNNPARCAFTLLSQPTNPNTPPTKLSGFFDIASLSAELALTDFTFGEFADLWTPSRTTLLRNQLDITGRIPAATLSYAPESGPVATFILDNVGINLPVPEQTTPSTPPDLSSITSDTFAQAPPRLLRMTDVSGRISIAANALRAELVGSIADVQCRAELTTRALSLSAPFRLDLSTAAPFSLRRRAAILPFAPSIVHERLQTFSGPSALVDAQVRIERRETPPDQDPGPLLYTGLLTFRDGRAAFEDFPYPFSNLSGVVRFNDSEIRIEKITGTHPSGAKLLAEGRIAPPSEDGNVELHITAVDVPLDAEFASCLSTDMQPIMDAVFDADSLDRLHAQSLLPTDPPFKLAGVADIDVIVSRPVGPDQEWTADVGLRADQAGVLARAFPLPAIAKDISILVRAGVADITIPRIEPLAGGQASLKGSVRLTNTSDTPTTPPPISISAQDVPISPLLLQALQDSVAHRENTQPQRPDAGLSILNRLRLEGLIDAQATIITTAAENADVDYDIHVQLSSLTARPAPLDPLSPEACSISDITGDLELTPTRFKIPRLEGRLLAPNSRDAGAFTLALEANIRTPYDQTPTFHADITTTNFDLAAPMDNILAAIVPDELRIATSFRQKHNPKGRVDAAVSLHSSPDRQSVRASATLFAARDASFDSPLGRIAISSSAGRAAIDDNDLQFDALTGAIALNDVPVGNIALRGSLALDDALPSDLHISFDSNNIPPDTLHHIVESINKSPINLQGARIGGAFSVNADLAKSAGAPELHSSVTIKPRAITIQSADQTLHFNRIAGAIIARDQALTFDELWASTDDLAIAVHGVIDPASGPDLRFSLSSPCLSPALLALLPEEPRQAMLAMGLDIQGPINIRNARLNASVPSPDAPLHFSGAATFFAASADLGLDITNARGELHVQAAPPHADLTVNLDTLKVAGLTVGNALADIHVDADQRTMVVQRATASCHAGQISVEAGIAPSDPANPDSPPRFEADVTLFGLALGPALQEARANWPAANPPVDGPPPDRGLLDAYVALSGSLDDPHSRIGRGSLRITQGKIVSFPIINRLIEISNLSLPLNSPLNDAYARFFMRGQSLTFERLNLASDAITIVGDGDVHLPDLDLNLRFTSRSNLRIPLLTDLFEAIRNEIITTTVIGPVTAPQISPSAFSGTRDLLDDLFTDPLPPEAPTLRPDR